MSHSRIVKFSPPKPVTKVLPSGEKHIDSVRPGLPLIV